MGSLVPYQPPAYTPPTAESLASDPGYQFRLNQGQNALQRSAAFKGTLRTGGTLQDLIRYGQDYASGELGSAIDRYNQGYDRQAQAAKDAAQMAWEQYQFANTPHGGGGGGRGPDIPPPPDLPPEYYPGDEGAGGPPGYTPPESEVPYY